MRRCPSCGAGELKIIAAILERVAIGALAHQYGMPAKLIERRFAACAAVGVDPSYFVQRYLDGDKNVPFDEAVDAAYRDLGC